MSENGKRLLVEFKGREGYDEGVVEESGSPIGEGENECGLFELSTCGVGGDELRAYVVVAGKAEGYEL